MNPNHKIKVQNNREKVRTRGSERVKEGGREEGREGAKRSKGSRR